MQLVPTQLLSNVNVFPLVVEILSRTEILRELDINWVQWLKQLIVQYVDRLLL